MATLLLGLGLSPVSTSPAQAAGGSATDWMTGRYGVMEHYLAEGCPVGCWGGSDFGTPRMPDAAQWSARVNNYDVAGVVEQLKSVGASWLQISVGQNTGFFAAPNATYDRLVPPTADHPSRLSQRDLIKDLGAALHKEGLKLIVYLTSDAIARDRYAREQLGGSNQGEGRPNATYQANWLNVVETWSQQWGTNVDGYWIDGSYYAELESFYDQMAAKLRSGNPNALLSFNAGFTVPLTSHTAESDFTPGETGVHDWPSRPMDGRWIDNKGTQMQLQYLATAQSDWGNPPDTPMSFTDDRLTDLTLSVTRVGGAVTWDVGYERHNGHISDAAMEQLANVGRALGAVGGDMAVGKTATQSSTGHGGAAARAVDGNTDGNFSAGSVTHTSDSPVDANPWWQVDLGASRNVGAVRLWNRTDCCSSRLANFYVFASDTPFTSNDPATTARQSGVWSTHHASAAGQRLTLQVNRPARYIRVQLVGSVNPLSLAEVQVYPSSNLALEKPATQSSTGHGGAAARAVDGNTDGNFSAGSVTHTSDSPVDANPWWQVDLGASRNVGAVRLWNRTDCCSSRLANFYVFASDTPFTSNDPATTANQSGVWTFHPSEAVGPSMTLQVNRPARYIRVQLVGSAAPLSLAEVQVFAGTDLAQYKPATQSSTLPGQSGDGANAAGAVDGGTNGYYTHRHRSVTHTSDSPVDANPWWQVDLGSSQHVNVIRVWNRTDCCSSRLANFYVFASDTPFTSNDPAITAKQSGVHAFLQPDAPNFLLNLPVDLTARYIRVQLVGSANPLSLAEVQVFGG